MNIGVLFFATDYSIDIAVLAKRMEDLGFESLWVPEHPIIPAGPTTPFPGSADGVIPKVYADVVDPFVALGRASAVTSTLKLGTGIVLVPERNPLLLAKEVATLDMYSGGRVLFGIGAGWLEQETAIMGGDFEHRWGQTREAVLSMKELWTKVESEYHGRYYDFPPVYSFPMPAQRPHPPVLLGGSAANVFKRVVAWGDGWIPTRIPPEAVKAGRAELDRLATEKGRDPASIEVSVFMGISDLDGATQYQDVGADRLVVRLETAGEPEVLAQLEDIAGALVT